MHILSLHIRPQRFRTNKACLEPQRSLRVGRDSRQNYSHPRASMVGIVVNHHQRSFRPSFQSPSSDPAEPPPSPSFPPTPFPPNILRPLLPAFSRSRNHIKRVSQASQRIKGSTTHLIRNYFPPRHSTQMITE